MWGSKSSINNGALAFGFVQIKVWVVLDPVSGPADLRAGSAAGLLRRLAALTLFTSLFCVYVLYTRLKT